MWQIMWMLNLLPDWFYHLIVIFSLLALIVASVFKAMPYRLPVRVFGALLLLFGIWMEGGIVNEAKWEARVKELEEKVKIAEEKSKEKNVEIQEKVVTQTKVVKEKGKDIIQYIDREVVKKEEIVKYIENCPVPKDIIDAHNAAAILNKATEVKK
jgi:hypothetical protein